MTLRKLICELKDPRVNFTHFASLGSVCFADILSSCLVGFLEGLPRPKGPGILSCPAPSAQLMGAVGGGWEARGMLIRHV